MSKAMARSPLFAAAEKAVERGATVALLTYLDDEGALHVVPIGNPDTSPIMFAGMLMHAQILMLTDAEENEYDE
jgi:hypothetical protein